jgi:hypothetical protein
MTQVQLEHNGEPAFGFSGSFRFLGYQSDINGRIVPTIGSGVYIGCSTYNHPCSAGQTLRILDHFDSGNPFRQGTDPVMVDGVTYPQVFYKASLVLDGGTIRIPYYLAKRTIVRLTVKATLNGSIAGYPFPSFVDPMFIGNVHLTGTVTVVLRRRGDGPAYDVTTVTYNFPAAGN